MIFWPTVKDYILHKKNQGSISWPQTSHVPFRSTAQIKRGCNDRTISFGVASTSRPVTNYQSARPQHISQKANIYQQRCENIRITQEKFGFCLDKWLQFWSVSQSRAGTTVHCRIVIREFDRRLKTCIVKFRSYCHRHAQNERFLSLPAPRTPCQLTTSGKFLQALLMSEIITNCY